MKITWHSEIRFTVAIVITLSTIASAGEIPFVPENDNAVLERIRTPSGVSLTRECRDCRARLSRDPLNLTNAAEVSRKFLEMARADADPRCFGYAEAALAPWWNLPSPPAPVLLLRATIRQSNHDFDSALTDLDAVLKLEPANAQAWLTRATILQVRGRYDEARRACLPLLRLAPELVSTACASGIASLTGQAEASYAALARVTERATTASSQERSWALTILAEIAARRGDNSRAEKHFRAALALAPSDHYLLGSYSDFLLEQHREREVIELLREMTAIDALLLRLCLAEKQNGSFEQMRQKFISQKTLLKARFQENRLRGNVVHRREEARFELLLEGHRGLAVTLAKANWEVQREPADLLILIESALADGDQATVRAAIRWIRGTKLEDVRVVKLLSLAKSTEAYALAE